MPERLYYAITYPTLKSYQRIHMRLCPCRFNQLNDAFSQEITIFGSCMEIAFFLSLQYLKKFMTKDKYHIQRVSILKQQSSASFIIEWCAFFVNKLEPCSLFIFDYADIEDRHKATHIASCP